MSHSSSEQPTNAKATLSETDLHRLLTSQRRRVLLAVLEDRSAPITLEELTSLVANREEGIDMAAADDLNEVEITLHHGHLPKLRDIGIIDYDPGENRVTAFRGLVR